LISSIKLGLLVFTVQLTSHRPMQGPAVHRSDAADVRGPKWNILAILTDDQAGWAFHADGNPDAVTPNMDRLAAEGARFSHAFTASGVCTSSRTAYLTGLFPIQAGMTDVPYRRDPDEGLPLGVPTWPKVLKQHGYVTGLIGKWHLGRTRANYPTKYGFAYFFGYLGGVNRPIDPVFLRDGHPTVIKGPEPDIVVDDALRFIERNQTNAFALLLHFRAPHAPHTPVPDVDRRPFAGREPQVPIVDPAQAILDDDQESADPEAIALHTRLLREKLTTYYASVHSVDRNLGRLLAALDSLDLTRRTIIVFTSDNGYLFGHRGLKGKGAAQPIRNHTLANDVFVVNMYDVALRVPLIVRWPGVIQPGTVIPELASNVDTYATVLGMLGIPRPTGTAPDSRDLSPLMRGDARAWPDTIFAEYTPDQIGAMQFSRMIRTPRWKLVRNYLNPGGNELYDLEGDPDEMRNLYYRDLRGIPMEADSGQSHRIHPHPFADVLARLQRRLEAWQRRIGDPALDLDARYQKAKTSIRSRWAR
jgi:uncharacterized sulfatase